VKHLLRKLITALRRKPKPVAPTSAPEVVHLRISGPEVTRQTSIVMNAVDTLAQMDAYRRQIAGDDPHLHHVLGGIEMTLARQLGRQFKRSQG
jgi:hypothetical protein